MVADRPSPRSELRYFIEILAMSGMAVSQPVLAAFGSSPEHLVFRGVTSVEIVVFAIAVVLVPPMVVAALSAVIGRLLPDRRHVVHAITLGLVFAFAMVQIGWRATSLTGLLLAGFAVAGGAAFVGAYLRWNAVRMWTAYAVAIPVVGLLSFLFLSPSSDIVFAPSVEAAALDLNETPPIVMLVLDELPTSTLLDADGGIDAQLFPAFAELAEDSTWYRNASTASNYTTWALPGLLSGTVPDGDALATLSEYPQNLFTLLADSYDIRADEAPIHLCPNDLCLGVASTGGGLSQLFGDARTLWRAQVSVGNPGSGTFDLIEEVATLTQPVSDFANEDERMAAGIREFQRLVTTSPTRFTSFLDAIRPSPRPTLNYLHLQIPHTPWRYYPSGIEYVLDTNEPAGEEGGSWSSTAASVVGRQRHILQAQYGDALLGQLLDRLHDQNMFDETLLIVVADHGLSFGEGEATRADSGEEFPTAQTGDVWWVPLFVKEPGQAAGDRSDLPIELIDVVPTVIDILDTDPGWDLDGTSATVLDLDDEQRTLCRRVRLGGFATDSSCPTIDGTDVASDLVRGGTGSFLADAVGDEWRVYRAGPAGYLVGLEVADIAVSELSDQQIEVDGLEAFDSVDPTSGKLPGLVTARLGSGAAGVDIGVAINGTLAATATSFDDATGSTGVVSAIIPDFVFRAGANEVAVYEIVPGPDAATLVPLDISR